ncbi:MAG: hypothetical protein HYZ93_00555, partial [Candidatus Omnitrophica bacterium]|nr:hypothetical protein [Candidatus Omnitrophota bacterium]
FSKPPAWAEYQAKGKRDPFVPLLTSEGQRIRPPGLDEEAATGLTGLILQGIIFDRQSESYAIINGRIVRPRERFDGMELLQVEPGAVTVLVEGQPHRLTLQQPKKEER